MAENKIKCPKCGTDIAITEVLSHQLNEQVEEKVNKKLAQQKESLIEDYKKKYEEEHAQVAKRAEMELAIKNKQLDEANNTVLESLKAKAALESKIKQQEIEIAKRVEIEKVTIEEKVRKEESEKIELKIAEKDKKIEEMTKALAEAQRKGQQGSMQTQGEVLELELEKNLKETFPSDVIEPVEKGRTGADIIQKVKHISNQTAGVIVWEAKRTKGWEDKWIEKLKEDGRNIKADACVLVSENLPKGVRNGSQYQGVWICNFSTAVSVSALLRHGILSSFSIALVNTGKDAKQEQIYDYLSSPKFRQKMEIIIENSDKMLDILETEKKWMNKKWIVEETRIRRLQTNTQTILNEIQSIGLSLPGIDQLTIAVPKIDEPNAKIKESKSNPNQKNLL